MIEKKIFVQGEKNVVNVYNIKYNERELMLYLDKITKELGCEFKDFRPGFCFLSFGYRKLNNTRQFCLKEKHRSVSYERNGKIVIEKTPSLTRYYFKENPFVTALYKSHYNRAIPLYLDFYCNTHPYDYISYPEVVDFYQFYDYLKQYKNLSNKKKEYLREYRTLLNIDYDNFEEYKLEDIKYDTNDSTVKELLKLIDYYRYDNVHNYIKLENVVERNKKVLKKIKNL